MPQWSNNNNYDTPSLTATCRSSTSRAGPANNALVIAEQQTGIEAPIREMDRLLTPLCWKVCYAQEYTLSYSGSGRQPDRQHESDGTAWPDGSAGLFDTGYDFVEWSDGSTDNPHGHERRLM